MSSKKLAPLVKAQLPTFAKESYPQFVDFITTYFEWLDETDNFAEFINSYQENIDIDQAEDDFVEQFLIEFAGDIPSYDIQIPKKELVKLIREFYISKGTEDSFKFIFRILYNKDVNITYPRKLMLATSDNIYDGDFVMNITKSTNKEYFVNDDSVIYIFDTISNYKTIVDELLERVDILGNVYFQAFLSSFDSGLYDQQNMELKLEIDNVIYSTNVIETINEIEIVDNGKGYSIGDGIYIDNDPTTGNAGTNAKITSINKGRINNINIVDGGSGFVENDFITISNSNLTSGYGFTAIVRKVDGNGSILSTEIVSQGYNYENDQYGEIYNPENGENTISPILQLTGDNLGSIKRIQILNGGLIYDESSIVLNIDSAGSGAILDPKFKNIFFTPKYLVNQKGFTSHNNVLTDSYYYQKFSYLVSSYEPPNKWKYAIKKNLHPAGLIQFNKWLYESNTLDGDIIGFVNSSTILNRILSVISEAIQHFLIGSEQVISLSVNTESETRMVGHNLRDLDSEKLLQNFNYNIGDFGDESINSVLNGKQVELNKVNESYITQSLT